MLSDSSLGSVLEAALGIHLKPDSPLTSQYLITADFYKISALSCSSGTVPTRLVVKESGLRCILKVGWY